MPSTERFVRDASGQLVVNTASPYWKYWLMPDEYLAEKIHHVLWLFFTRTPQALIDLLKRTCDVAGCEMALGSTDYPLVPAVELKPLELPSPLFWLGSDKADSVTPLPKGTLHAVRVYVEPVDRYVTPSLIYNVLHGMAPELTMLGVERTAAASSLEEGFDLLDYSSDVRPLRPVKYSEYLSSNAYYLVSAGWDRNVPTTVELDRRLAGAGLEYIDTPGAAVAIGPATSFVMGTGQKSPQVETVKTVLGANKIYIDRVALSSSQAAMLKLTHDTEPIRSRIYDVGFTLADGTLGLVETAASVPGDVNDPLRNVSPVLKTVGWIALGMVSSYALYRLYQATWSKR